AHRRGFTRRATRPRLVAAASLPSAGRQHHCGQGYARQTTRPAVAVVTVHANSFRQHQRVDRGGKVSWRLSRVLRSCHARARARANIEAVSVDGWTTSAPLRVATLIAACSALIATTVHAGPAVQTLVSIEYQVATGTEGCPDVSQ